MIKINRYVTPRTTRFAQIGEADENTCEVIFALHGWGQLAGDFAEVMTPLATEGRLIICPEALSKFYVGFQPRETGSSWMTSYDREYEIMDYVTYLDGLAEQVLADVPEHAHIIVFAFSQGCHTASRWIGNGVVKPKKMILWGSDPAEDLGPEEWDAVSDIDHIQVVAGTMDRFVTGGKLQRAEESLRDHQCTFEIIRYEGGHHLQDSVLMDLFSSQEDSLELKFGMGLSLRLPRDPSSLREPSKTQRGGHRMVPAPQCFQPVDAAYLRSIIILVNSPCGVLRR